MNKKKKRVIKILDTGKRNKVIAVAEKGKSKGRLDKMSTSRA